MDWNALKVFLAIADSGSLSGAARELDVDQSTVFRRLNSFEEALGGRLFERFRHGYELTSMGEELRAIAKNIAGSFDDIERRVIGKDIQPRGKVRITAPNNIAYRYLPRYLSAFNRSYPDIQVELLVSNLEFNMNNRQADIAVRATAMPPEHLVGRQVREIGWSIYGGVAYQERYGVSLPERIEQLKTHRLIGGCGVMGSLPAFTWLERNLAEQIVVRSDDMVAMSYFAEVGQGLAVLPDDQQRPGITRLFSFDHGHPSKLWILTHPDLRHAVRIKLLMQHLAEAFEEEPGLGG